MKFIILLCLLSQLAYGQLCTSATSPCLLIPSTPIGSAVSTASGTLTFSSGTSTWLPTTFFNRSAHEYALATMKEYQDYLKLYHSEMSDTELNFAVGNLPNGDMQSFTVLPNGKVELKNITIEDAFLSLYADRVKDDLAELKKIDAEDRERTRERKSIPPADIITGNTAYSVNNIADWSNGMEVGDTNCVLQRVRILKTDPTKRDTMLHEIMHVATNCDTDKNLHKAIYRLTPSLLQILRSNPDLVKYLMAK